MPRYFVSGGRQRPSHLLTREEWHAYEMAVLLELDTDSGAVRTVLQYQSPEGRRPVERPSFVFKAASWDGDHLLLCTQTEVVVFDPRAERVVRTVSHPWFNDVHHVARLGGRLHVVSTGLDALLLVDDAGVVEHLLPAVEGAPWDRLDAAVDQRLVATTKPHRSHPNYVAAWGGALWLTRFEQRDVVRLSDGAAVLLADDPVHDGVPADGGVWFTVVSGSVVVVDPSTATVRRRITLPVSERPLGWCRGVHVESDRLLLGYSRLRPTTLKQNLAWLRAPLGKAPEPLPTRVAAHDRQDGRLLEAWGLELAGMSSVFSILPADPPRGARVS